MDKQKRTDWLEREIKFHRELYYNTQPAITDIEFDALIKELQNLQLIHVSVLFVPFFKPLDFFFGVLKRINRVPDL